jgi:hypothetical protein
MRAENVTLGESFEVFGSGNKALSANVILYRKINQEGHFNLD